VPVRFTCSDPSQFAHVSKSVSYGRRSFPTREDYEEAAVKAGLATAGETWTNPELAAAAARHWHTTGQTGCLFARLLSGEADDARWPTVVLDDASPATAAEIAKATREAGEADGCDLISFVIPTLTDIRGAREIVVALAETEGFDIFESREVDGHVIVAVRAALPDGLTAWAISFGPLPEWPATRRGPMFELVLRVKPKPDRIFHKLNQDPKVAHLADINLDRDDEHLERLYSRSKRATEDVLGAHADKLSAARATFSFPTDGWDALGPSGLPERELEPTQHPD
jgi:hypothetical protein